MKYAIYSLLITSLIISVNCSNTNMTNLSEEERRAKEMAFLDKHIFQGLTNLNDGFDSESIKYFSELEFEVVLKRVEEFGLGIYGIEPWLSGEYYDVYIHEDYNLDSKDPKWYKSAFEKFKKEEKKLQYSASYEVPLELIETK